MHYDSDVTFPPDGVIVILGMFRHVQILTPSVRVFQNLKTDVPKLGNY